jgi:uncharacterized iron-regulated membrane protein
MIRLILTFSLLLLLQRPALALTRPPLDEAGPSAAVVPLVATQEAKEEREPGPADLAEAIEIALKRYGGRAASSETVVRDGRRVHEIRVLGDDGSVRTVRIDPDTGAIIPQRR